MTAAGAATARLPWDGAGSNPVLSGVGRAAFRLLLISLVLPFFDLPLLGVSISAPFFGFVLIETLGSGVLRRPRYFGCLAGAGLFAVAQTGAFAIRVLGGEPADPGVESVGLLIRYGYWAGVFAVTAVVVHNDRLGGDVALTLGLSVTALACVRLGEGVVFGHWGGGNPRFLSQNDYGFVFSMFAPFAFWLSVRARGWASLGAAAAGLSVVAAVVGNGSRSSWLSLTAGMMVMAALFALRREGPRFLTSLAVLGAIGALGLGFAPESVRAPILARFETLDQLSADKPYQARKVLVEKGLALFRESPLVGVGAGRFTREWADLDLPASLRYQPPAFYNRRRPHNAYVKLLAEGGVVGIAPFALLWAWVAWGGLRRALRARSAASSWVPAAYASFLAASVHLWTLSGLTGAAPWFVLGLAGAAALSGVRVTPRTIRQFVPSHLALQLGARGKLAGAPGLDDS